MATVGKRKKVYIVRKKSNMAPLLIGGAVLAYLFLSRNNTAAPDTAVVTTPGGLSTNPNPVIVDDGSGTGTVVIQPTPVSVLPGENMSAVNTVASNDRLALIRDAAAYPLIVAALKVMSSAEIIDTYNYFYNFYLPGKTLYRYPDSSHPGDWNTALYDAIQVIRSKYHIF